MNPKEKQNLKGQKWQFMDRVCEYNNHVKVSAGFFGDKRKVLIDGCQILDRRGLSLDA